MPMRGTLGVAAVAIALAFATPAEAQSHWRGGGGWHGGWGGWHGGWSGWRGGWGWHGGWGWRAPVGFYGGWYGSYGYYPAPYAYYPRPAYYYPSAPPTYAPPAQYAPQPEASRAYQVFFDFDKAAITPDAAKVIEAAAEAFKAGRAARISVIGHTDTTGTQRYNQRLSEYRAAAVRRALIADGVSPDAIATSGVGKTGLLVPTGDQVRDPQNRRVEIDLIGGPGPVS
jgi:outer membrane protein OmpA-like peptidoglycan-associated protein